MSKRATARNQGAGRAARSLHQSRRRAAVRLAIESLEDRRLLAANVTASLVDAGDYYWADDKRISLLRATDEFLVRLDAGMTFSALSQPGASLAGYQQAARLRSDLVSVKANQPITDQALASFTAQADIDWAGHGFVNSTNGSRVWIADEVIVALDPGVKAAHFFATNYAYRPLIGTPDQFVVTVSGGPDAVLDQANAWNDAAGVRYASPNFYHQLAPQALTPDDPLFADQWHLNNTGQSGGKSGADIDAPDAWSTATGSNVVIAIVDSGMQLNHPDLAANIFINRGEVPNNNIDDDGNGWVDDVNGWDFVDNDNDPSPAHTGDNHATVVAGTAAAVGNNGVGVTGVAFGAKILPVKIGLGNDFTSDDDIASAIYYAGGRTADGLGTWRGADVMNNSWGGGTPNDAIRDAMNWAATNGRQGKGALVFVASGNDASAYETLDAGTFDSGTYIFEWRYTKDASDQDDTGDDTAWLAEVSFPDGSVQRFESLSLPTGWSTSGDANWTIVDDPAHAYGTGRYQAKAGTISHNQTTRLRSKPISVVGSGEMSFKVWASSEFLSDEISLFVSSNGGATFTDTGASTSGVAFFLDQDVGYPADLPNVFGIGATTDWDYRADYSQFGDTLDFVAPSGGGTTDLLATDRTGGAGYDPTDYAHVPGTSFSSPVAAGIGALLLSKDPSLTVAQVRTILQNSADKIGGVTYTNGFSPYYGYGRLNAAKALAALGTGVEMNVQGNDVEITDGDTTPSKVDKTDFGSVDVALGSATTTFTIRNTGTAGLIFNGNPRIQITGVNSTDFSVVASPPGNLAAGAATSFQITFNPSGAGLRTAIVNILNNDPNENPYNFSIQGTGATGSEMDVKGNNVSIADGDWTPSLTDFTDFGSLDPANGSLTRTFTISNTGSTPLNLTGTPLVRLSGGNVGDFTVAVQPAATVGLAASTTFQITFNPTAIGLRSTTVSIVNNDPNENPYDFVIQGTGFVPPEMAVRGNNVEIIDGDTSPSLADFTDFGPTDLTSGTVTRVFTINNTGTGPLNLTGSPRVQITGTNAADFVVTVLPAATVSANASTTFQVRFNPSALGVRSALVNIVNNDSNENPYNFAIQGTGTSIPEIDIRGNGVSIPDNDTTPSTTDFTNFGPLDINASAITRTYIVVNTGAGALTLSGTPRVLIGGTNAADFTVATLPAQSIAAGASSAMIIAFNPSAVGVRTATVTIVNNDSNENPYNFTLQGTGTASTEIDVRGNGLSVSSGDTIPSVTDGTDYGSVDVATGAVGHVFTVANLGSLPLSLTGTPRVQFSGANPGDFSVNVQPPASIGVGSSSSFQIIFNPSAAGARSATVTIANNDTNEGVYTFKVQGFGATVATDVGDTIATATSTGLTSAGGTSNHSNPIGNGSFGSKDVDIYSFQAAAGNTLTAQTAAPASGPAMDTYMRLFNSAGVQLAANDDASTQTLYSRIANFTIPLTGTYYVAVSGYGNSTYIPTVGGSGKVGATGSYDLSVSLSAPVQAAVSSGSTAHAFPYVATTATTSSGSPPAPTIVSSSTVTAAAPTASPASASPTARTAPTLEATPTRQSTALAALDAVFAQLGYDLIQSGLTARRSSRIG